MRTSVNSDFATREIANFSKALNLAFDILDEARINISRTENARLLCQCHYLSTDNMTESQREAFCPSDYNGMMKRCLFAPKEDLLFFLVTNFDGDDEQPFLDSTGCNKMIMIVTDGATETALNVFQSRNWHPNNVSTCHPIEVMTIAFVKCSYHLEF